MHIVEIASGLRFPEKPIAVEDGGAMGAGRPNSP
jgi:hypothetical protein